MKFLLLLFGCISSLTSAVHTSEIEIVVDHTDAYTCDIGLTNLGTSPYYEVAKLKPPNYGSLQSVTMLRPNSLEKNKPMGCYAWILHHLATPIRRCFRKSACINESLRHCPTQVCSYCYHHNAYHTDGFLTTDENEACTDAECCWCITDFACCFCLLTCFLPCCMAKLTCHKCCQLSPKRC